MQSIPHRPTLVHVLVRHLIYPILLINIAVCHIPIIIATGVVATADMTIIGIGVTVGATGKTAIHGQKAEGVKEMKAIIEGTIDMTKSVLEKAEEEIIMMNRSRILPESGIRRMMIDTGVITVEAGAEAEIEREVEVGVGAGTDIPVEPVPGIDC